MRVVNMDMTGFDDPQRTFEGKRLALRQDTDKGRPDRRQDRPRRTDYDDPFRMLTFMGCPPRPERG
jgi:hypothetical protein